MKLATSIVFAIASLGALSAFAADTAPAGTLTPQQQKMSDCSKDAHTKNLKGDDYKSFMSTCMKSTSTAAKPAATAAPTAATDKTAAAKPAGGTSWVAAPDPGPAVDPAMQQKRKACATDAKSKGVKGTDRRAFMTTCMKSADAATTAKPAAAK